MNPIRQDEQEKQVSEVGLSLRIYMDILPSLFCPSFVPLGALSHAPFSLYMAENHKRKKGQYFLFMCVHMYIDIHTYTYIYISYISTESKTKRDSAT